MGTSAITPQIMTGVSTMSSDLQSVLTRAVNIASLPLKQLQSHDSDAIQRKGLLSGLSSAAQALGSAVTQLSTIASGGSLTASSSDTSKVTVQNAGATIAGVYTVSDITSIAAAASETTLSGVADSNATPVSSTGSMSLTVGSTQYPITLTTNTLAGLRDKINGLNAGVTATILSSGPSSYLSISANTTGAAALTLTDDPGGAGHANTPMLTSTNQGSNAVFKLNGIPVNRTTNAVNDVVPGITFNILQTTGVGGKVSLSLATDSSQLSGAISNFVSAYNAMGTSVRQQVGSNAGLLSGDYAVREIQSDMRALSSYAGAGVVKSLADMGITFDQTGTMTFSASQFNSLSDAQVQGALSFFGSATTGFGALAQKFTSLTDPVTGVIKLEQDGLDQTDKSLQSQIGTLTDRINAMQTALSAQLQAADALLASLQSQQQMLNASIQSLNYAAFGKAPNSQ